MLRLQQIVECNRWLVGLGAALVLCLAPPDVDAKVTPTPAGLTRLEKRLVKALASADLVEVERTARLMGIGVLIKALKKGSRPLKMAALTAIPMAEKSWLLLGATLEQMKGRDRSIAVRAARTAVQVTEDLRQPTLDLNEDSAETLGRVSHHLERLASDSAVSLEIRIYALKARAQLRTVVQGERKRLLRYLDDPEARVREAAVELFATDSSLKAIKRLAKMAAEDTDHAAARAAAVVLCARVPPRRTRKPSAELAALREARAAGRLRRQVESPDARNDQLVDLARCLKASRGREDRRALARLGRRSATMRRMLRRALR
jgi:hypothetical protein